MSLPQASSAPLHPPSIGFPPGPLDGPATRLRAYPVSFRPVIERAKLIAQCNCASVNPFIARPEFVDQRSFEYFNEALVESSNVPQGEYNLKVVRVSTLNILFLGYWPQYRKELSVLVRAVCGASIHPCIDDGSSSGRP